jgi:hypothetical protein
MILPVKGRMADMETLTKHQKKDIRLLGTFTEVYCAGKHFGAGRTLFSLPAGLGMRTLCPECAAFLEYAVAKRIKCPLEAEKPACKRCRIHCYAKLQREKVREIMAYSGRTLVLQGRLDYLWHFLT